MKAYFKKWLEDEGVSITTVARRAGISCEALQDLAWGQDSLTVEDREKLAELMGVRPNEVTATVDQIAEIYSGGRRRNY